MEQGTGQKQQETRVERGVRVCEGVLCITQTIQTQPTPAPRCPYLVFPGVPDPTPSFLGPRCPLVPCSLASLGRMLRSSYAPQPELFTYTLLLLFPRPKLLASRCLLPSLDPCSSNAVPRWALAPQELAACCPACFMFEVARGMVLRCSLELGTQPQRATSGHH